MRALRRLAPWGVAAGVALETCSPSSQAHEPLTLTVGVQADVTGIYPQLRNEAFTGSVNGEVFEGLTRLGRDLEPQPGLADSWQSPDDRTWLFHLRPNVHFSNGALLVASDVVASLCLAQKEEATRYLLSPVESIEEVDPHEVRILTRFPFPPLPSHLVGAYVLPASILAQRPVLPIGTGPYTLEKRVPAQGIDLVENPLYRGQKPTFKRIRYRVIGDAQERVRSLLEGRTDVIDNLPPDQIPELRRHSEISVVSRPGLRVLFLVLRMDQPPFSNAFVREAIDLAIDRDQLVATALHGFGASTYELVPPAVFGYNSHLDPPKPDRSRAAELLKAGGFPGGFRTRLHGPTNRYVNGPGIMQEVARQLGEVGIRVDIDARPKEQFFSLVDTPEPRFFLYGWSCETAQAGEVLDELVRTPAPGSLNVASFSDPKLDELIDKADHSPSIRERSRFLSSALARVAGTHAFLPLLIQSESFASSRRLAWEPSLDMAFHASEVKLGRVGQGSDPTSATGAAEGRR